MPALRHSANRRNGASSPSCAIRGNARKHTNKITTMDAFTEIGCTRLSARIYELRELGYPIKGIDKMKRLPNGKVKRWKEYLIINREGRT